MTEVRVPARCDGSIYIKTSVPAMDRDHVEDRTAFQGHDSQSLCHGGHPMVVVAEVDDKEIYARP